MLSRCRNNALFLPLSLDISSFEFEGGFYLRTKILVFPSLENNSNLTVLLLVTTCQFHLSAVWDLEDKLFSF